MLIILVFERPSSRERSFLQEVKIFILFHFSFSFSSSFCNYFSFRMRMVVLDDDGTSSGDSSSTLMDSFSRRDKLRVLQIGGYLNDVGEDEIESEMGAIDRSRTDLDSNAHRMSSGGTGQTESAC